MPNRVPTITRTEGLNNPVSIEYLTIKKPASASAMPPIQTGRRVPNCCSKLMFLFEEGGFFMSSDGDAGIIGGVIGAAASGAYPWIVSLCSACSVMVVVCSRRFFRLSSSRCNLVILLLLTHGDIRVVKTKKPTIIANILSMKACLDLFLSINPNI